jgi:hypothetical protein
MRWARVLAVSVVSPWLAGCSSTPGAATNNYGAAAVGAAVTVATVGLMRAATGECWARCSQGMVCDHESGLCVEGECYPACGWGQHCVRLSTGLDCVPDPNAGLTSVASQPAPPAAPSAAAPEDPPAPAPSGSAQAPAAGTSAEPAAASSVPAEEEPPSTWFDPKAPPAEPEPTAPPKW